MARRKFSIILIKPSHYDEQGYVIQWRRSTIPSNSLASVYGLLAECAEAEILGPDVEIEIDAYDECNTVIDVKGTIQRLKASGSKRSSPMDAASSSNPADLPDRTRRVWSWYAVIVPTSSLARAINSSQSAG